MNHAIKVQLLALINIVISIWACFTYPEYIIYGVIGWAFVNIFSTNIAIHRFMSHRAFRTTPIKENI